MRVLLSAIFAVLFTLSLSSGAFACPYSHGDQKQSEKTEDSKTS